MARSSSNVTFVHFSLIFFVMLSVILGVLSYLNIDRVASLRQKANEEAARAEERDRQLDNYQQAFKKLKELAGYLETMKQDASDQDGGKSPLQRLRADLNRLGEGNANLRAVLHKLLAEIDKRENALEDAGNDYQSKLARLNSQLQQAQDDHAEAERKLNAAQAEVVKIRNDQQEKLRNQRAQILQLQSDKKALQGEIQALEDQQKQIVQEFEKKIRDMEETIALKQRIIDNLLNVSFETPDGVVRWVDNRSGLVWINLGSEDRLPEKMTFSVYRKNHNGIARDSNHRQKLREMMDQDAGSRKFKDTIPEDFTGTQSDIKGAIEITRIVGPHLAEARILENELSNPIRAGDPIYTPLWSPGIEESFAFAVHLDGVKFSGLDNNLLFRIVRASGAKISTYIDSEGKMAGRGVTEKDKFLVVTDLPDPKTTADPQERKRRENMAAARLTLEQQARRNGVRIVQLSDFLAYIGYKPDRRLWRPGEHSTRQLKAGAHSTTVNQTVGRRQSSGQTSGIYTKRGRIIKPQSSGQTSKIFGGGSGGY